VDENGVRFTHLHINHRPDRLKKPAGYNRRPANNRETSPSVSWRGTKKQLPCDRKALRTAGGPQTEEELWKSREPTRDELPTALELFSHRDASLCDVHESLSCFFSAVLSALTLASRVSSCAILGSSNCCCWFPTPVCSAVWNTIMRFYVDVNTKRLYGISKKRDTKRSIPMNISSYRILPLAIKLYLTAKSGLADVSRFNSRKTRPLADSSSRSAAIFDIVPGILNAPAIRRCLIAPL